MRAFNDTQLNNKSFRVSAGVTLRECSVVIIGSTCKICGRNFKCESDVSLHSRWRHNGTIGSLIDNLCHELYLERFIIGEKCDICDIQFKTATDLKIHKRLIHKHGTRSKYRKRPGKETIRVKFKLKGITTMDVYLDRKYLNVENNLKHFVNIGTQTPDSLENERHQDNYAADIDLFLSDHVVDNSHMQYIRPHKATNRYIVGKFMSTKGDTTAHSTPVGGRSLIEISNTPHVDVITGSNDSCEEYENHRNLTSQENTASAWTRSFNNLDIHNKENSQGKLNERERENVYCQTEFLLNDNKNTLICQRDKTTLLTSKQITANGICHDPIKQSNGVTEDKGSTGLTNSLTDFEEIIIDNENNNKISETTTKRSLAPLTRSTFNNRKNELIKNNSNIDDDVQEVLRITRRNLQSDINHESPNRIEREILVQDTINDEMFSKRKSTKSCSEKCNVGFMANFEPSSYSTFTTVTKSSYQFVANTFEKKLDICLEDMHHYGIKSSYYNKLMEINNNNLEEYAIYAHQGLLQPRIQAEKP